VVVAAGVVPDSEGAEASFRDVLAAVLEASRQLAETAAELREENARLRKENARLRARDAEGDAEMEGLRADLAVLQRMLFGRSARRSASRPQVPTSSCFRLVHPVSPRRYWTGSMASAASRQPS
jgi:hypothetical protein